MTKGCVINLASGAGLFGRMNQSSYAAAKEGIRGMSRVTATEWGPDGIRVNCLCPLAMTEQLIQWKEEYPESLPLVSSSPSRLAATAIRRTTSVALPSSWLPILPSTSPVRPSLLRVVRACVRKVFRSRNRFAKRLDIMSGRFFYLGKHLILPLNWSL